MSLQAAYHFPCPIYLIEKPEFIDAENAASEESLSPKRADLDDLYPVLMSDNLYEDARVGPFAEFVGQTAWNILSDQGYAMDGRVVAFSEMWTQEHHKHSLMEQHIHGHGAQIVGFYFLEAPEGSSRVVFHDPRASKLPIDLPEKDVSQASVASKMINFEPKPGLMIFANAWLAHSFTRHAAETPIKFVHFNLVVRNGHVCPAAEVV